METGQSESVAFFCNADVNSPQSSNGTPTCPSCVASAWFIKQIAMKQKMK